MSEVEGQLYALVMAGGRGTRFWPESTSKRPKQYLNLTGDKPLLEKTLDRFEGLVASENRFIVTVKEQEALATECGRDKISHQGLIFEPSGRNTAPCILLSLASIEAMGAKENDVIAIVPSDHVILNEQGFRNTVKSAAIAALKEDNIVTIGIKPNFPHTGYGYIKRGEVQGDDAFEVSQFVEKPNRETAEEYVRTGEYFWNAGMFVASVKRLKEEFKSCAHETFKFYDELLEAIKNKKDIGPIYEKLPKDSIDYAVMEKSQRVSVVAADFDWNDLGSWDALESVVKPTKDNTLIGGGESFIKDAKGNIVFAPNRHISLIGVENLIIVSNEKTVMVLPKNRSQEVKDIVASISESRDLGGLL